MVGAAGGRHRRLRAGRARALPGARGRARGQEWLSRAVKGWVGRVTAARRAGQGWFVLRRDRGRAAGGAAAVAEQRGERQLAAVHRGGRRARCWSWPARGWTRARCAAPPAAGRARARPGHADRSSRATASRASSSRSTGTRTRSPRSSSCPRPRSTAAPPDRPLPAGAARALHPHARHRRRRRTRASRWPGCAPSTTRDRRRPPLSRRRRRACWRCEDRLGGELRPFQRAGVSTRSSRGALFIADEQGLGKTVEALAPLEEDDAYPGGRHLPGQPEAQLAARDRALAPAPLAARRRRHRQGDPEGRHHGPQLRDRPRPPRAAGDRAAARR